MDVKFNEATAQQLIQKMDMYCQVINKDANEMLDLLEMTGEWKDSQKNIFSDNTIEICRGLVSTMKNYSEYTTLYRKRVEELRG